MLRLEEVDAGRLEELVTDAWRMRAGVTRDPRVRSHPHRPPGHEALAWRRAREPFAAMNADPEVMRYFPAPLDRAASDALVDRIEDLFRRQGFGLWALEVGATAPELASTGSPSRGSSSGSPA